MFSTGKYWKYTRGKSRYLTESWFSNCAVKIYFDLTRWLYSNILSIRILIAIVSFFQIYFLTLSEYNCNRIGIEKEEKKYTQCIIGINKVNFDLRYVKEIQIYIWIMNTWNLNNGLEYFIREKLFRGYLHSKIENVLLKHTLQSSVSELKICSPVDRSLVCLVLQGWQRSE